MIKVVIHYDNGVKEVAAEGTWVEVLSKVPDIIATIDPDIAVWEFVQVVLGYSLELAAKHVNDQLGNNI